MTAAVLVINAGSSSVKAAAFPAEGGGEALWRGAVLGIGGTPRYVAHLAGGEGAESLPVEGGDQDHESLTGWLLARIGRECPGLEVVAAGHRVVHGGRDFDAPVVITDAVIDALRGLIPLAPAHQPHNLAGIRAVADRWPAITQVAAFDTAFHRTQPRLAQLFALPRTLADEGVLRYGFHGLSYQHIADVLPRYAGGRADGRVIVAHLGHGASLCAMLGRQSVATSMGFTALDGLVMGRRCGTLDPGVIFHLMRDRGMSAEQVEAMLSRESGLLGLSGISDDMQTLLASDDANAEEAVALFVYRAVSLAGSLIATLGGLDALVFTGGIGEHAAPVRARIVDGLAWLGMSLDERANAAGDVRLHDGDSAVGVFAVPADEERVIARQTRHLTLAP
ncbi:acetate/propionate family kinase [Arhodomonas sp. AD133]|uniref:acetate/propionate family kinase n=1 Tax=Arhodomonas sp. AD133 TaxID=3415009 RepID=UPI003EBE0A26